MPIDRSLSKLLAGGIALAVASTNSSAQNLPNAAFECAALALHFDDDHPMAGEAERLFRIGREAATMEWQQLAAQDGWTEAFGGHQFLADLPTDFFVGMGFQSALVTINELVEAEVPNEPGVGFKVIADLRDLLAANEFDRRNCAFITGR